MTEHRIVFFCSPGDDREIEACQATGETVVVMREPPTPGDYARKINMAFKILLPGELWVFTAADDLCFCPNWDWRALTCAQRLNKTVIGTNDLGNERVMRGDHSTHTLVSRFYVDQYGTCDEAGKLYHEGYGHWFCDDEMVRTARVRGEFVSCLESEVPHLHPEWGKGVHDATYEKGQSSLWHDKELFESRRPLWEGPEMNTGAMTVPSRV